MSSVQKQAQNEEWAMGVGRDTVNSEIIKKKPDTHSWPNFRDSSHVTYSLGCLAGKHYRRFVLKKQSEMNEVGYWGT